MIQKKYFLLLIVLQLFTSQSKGQNLISAILGVEKNSQEVTVYLDYYGINTEGLDIPALKFYKITYYTSDVHGNQTIASGSLTIPQLPACNYLPMVVWHHGTEYDKNQVSSQAGGEAIVGLIFGSFGYAVAMPDYLGMGDNPGIHPYHHAESEATASIDLIRACREFMENTLLIQDNNQLFISGYSQGGHATMALHKYIQENNLYSEFNVVASAPMSGAYDLSGAQFDLIFDTDSSFYRSEFIPYILASYQLVYGNIYDSFAQLYDEDYASQIEQYLSENHTWNEWAEMIPNNYYEFMQDSVLNNMFADGNRTSHPILKALRANNLYNWVPEREVKMLYCGMDSMVSPQNSLNTLDSMIALGANDVSVVEIDPNGVHETCFFPSISYAINWFDNLTTRCQYVTEISDIQLGDKLKVYPNPATDKLYVDTYPFSDFEIFSVDGNKIQSGKLNQNNWINISKLTPGVYIINCKDSKTKNNFRSLFIKE